MRIVKLQTLVFAISKACLWQFRIWVQPLTKPLGTYTYSLLRMDDLSCIQTSGEYFFTREAALAAGQSALEDLLKYREFPDPPGRVRRYPHRCEILAKQLRCSRKTKTCEGPGRR
jgi:hypothetical protein